MSDDARVAWDWAPVARGACLKFIAGHTDIDASWVVAFSYEALMVVVLRWLRWLRCLNDLAGH